jgi:multiple sugar transport system permease protein
LSSVKETPLRPAAHPSAPLPAAETHHRQVSWSRSQSIKRAAAHVALLAVGILFFLPFFWLVSTSLKELDQIFKLPPIWIPNPVRWQNYPEALTYFPFLQQLGNTLIITLSSVALALVSSSLVAYSFSRLRWPGRNVMFFIMLATMMLPYQVTMVPLFIIFRQLGWVNTFLPLIVPNMFGVPFFIFLLRQFFLSLPRDLDDAAIIDGCSEWGVYRHIILPLSKPALATVALFQFLGSWNDFLGPLIYLSDPTKYTLSLGIQVFVSTVGVQWGWMMAVTTVLTIPVIMLFFFTQRTFIQGIAFSGIKA